jgi:hypothetical protein
VPKLPSVGAIHRAADASEGTRIAGPNATPQASHASAQERGCEESRFDSERIVGDSEKARFNFPEKCPSGLLGRETADPLICRPKRVGSPVVGNRGLCSVRLVRHPLSICREAYGRLRLGDRFQLALLVRNCRHRPSDLSVGNKTLKCASPFLDVNRLARHPEDLWRMRRHWLSRLGIPQKIRRQKEFPPCSIPRIPCTGGIIHLKCRKSHYKMGGIIQYLQGLI